MIVDRKVNWVYKTNYNYFMVPNSFHDDLKYNNYFIKKQYFSHAKLFGWNKLSNK